MNQGSTLTLGGEFVPTPTEYHGVRWQCLLGFHSYRRVPILWGGSTNTKACLHCPKTKEAVLP